jgi:hypothetical protein
MGKGAEPTKQEDEKNGVNFFAKKSFQNHFWWKRVPATERIWAFLSLKNVAHYVHLGKIRTHDP